MFESGDLVDKPSFEESLRTLAARRQQGESHPAPDELVAYRAGDLTAEEDDRIQEHLTHCRDCARLLLDLAEFEQMPLPPVEVGPVDARAEASWQRLQARLGEEDQPKAKEPEMDAAAMAPVRELRSRPVVVPVWRRPAIPWLLAAGLGLCVIGLGLRVGTLQSEVDQLSAPRLNVSFEDLYATGTTRGITEDDVPILHGGGVLVVTPPSESAEYEIEVAPAAGGALVIEPLRDAARDGVLTLGIPPSYLREGRYTARLYGIENGQRQPLGEYPFEIAPAIP
jgi:hypothetical protein